jgi:hypothetical protein
MRKPSHFPVSFGIWVVIVSQAGTALANEADSNVRTDDPLREKYPYEIGFVITNPVNEKAWSGMTYRIVFPSGITAQGVTDSQGRTARFRTERAENLKLYVRDPSASVHEQPK